MVKKPRYARTSSGVNKMRIPRRNADEMSFKSVFRRVWGCALL